MTDERETDFQKRMRVVAKADKIAMMLSGYAEKFEAMTEQAKDDLPEFSAAIAAAGRHLRDALRILDELPRKVREEKKDTNG